MRRTLSLAITGALTGVMLGAHLLTGAASATPSAVLQPGLWEIEVTGDHFTPDGELDGGAGHTERRCVRPAENIAADSPLGEALFGDCSVRLGETQGTRVLLSGVCVGGAGALRGWLDRAGGQQLSAEYEVRTDMDLQRVTIVGARLSDCTGE